MGRERRDSRIGVIGIDPGLTGAISFIHPEWVEVQDTPVVKIQKAGKSKNEYAPAAMACLIKEKMANFPGIKWEAFVEKVGPMPGQGVTSMFGFGKGFGLWIGILAGIGVPVTFPTPQAWKKEIMQGFGDKDAARIRAMEVFPIMSGQLSRKCDIGRADALLIAEYGRRVIK